MRARRRNTRSNLLAMRRRDSGGLTVDGAEVLIIEEESSKDMLGLVWLVVLVGMAE